MTIMMMQLMLLYIVGIDCCSLWPVFDPLLSPRNLMLTAVK